MSFMLFRQEQCYKQAQGEEQKDNDNLKRRDDCASHV